VIKGLIEHIRQLVPTIDRNGQFLFFEIKKSATTSIRRKVLKDRSIVYKDYLNKYYPIFDSYSPEDLDNIFKFTVVRNPYARVVSAFIYLKKHNELTKQKNMDFKRFVKNVLRKQGTKTNPHFHRMANRAYFENEMFLDFVGKLENIDKDWSIISKNINGPNRLPHINKGNHSNYRDYYDDECIKIVSRIYAEDLELFKYKF